MKSGRVMPRPNLRYSDISHLRRTYLGQHSYSGVEQWEMVGTHPLMEGVFESILRASRGDEPVLILGETGTGKELVARCVHALGSLRDRPFIPVDCCSLPPMLVESELFGHVRGAFTGAVTSKVGLFEAAELGTIFLDEVAEMPVHLQAKLLRAVQERRIRRVGGTTLEPFGARIIAATNKKLEAAVQEGSFRSDLYYRLDVLRVELPPLRDRKSDIPLLAHHFLHKACGGFSDLRELSESALDCLLSYEWPGNVRELENCIRRTVALSSSPTIHADNLPENIRHPERWARAPRQPSVATLEEIEREAIMRAIRDANGNKLLAARILGIGKTTLYRKVKSYDMGDNKDYCSVIATVHRDPATGLNPCLRSVYETPGIGFAVCDANLRYRTLNESLAVMNGLPVEAHLGKTFHEVLGAVGAQIECLAKSVLDNGRAIFNHDVAGKLPSRAEPGHWIGSLFPITDSAGRVVEIGIIVVEITKQKQIEQALCRLGEQLLKENRDEYHWITTRFLDSVEQYYASLRINLGEVTAAMEKLMSGNIAQNPYLGAIHILDD